LKKRSFVLMVSTIAFLMLALGMAVFIPGNNYVQAAQPDRLRIDGTAWDSVSQQFVVDLSCQKGKAKGGSKAGFLVSTELRVSTGGYDAVLTWESPIEIENPIPDADGKVQIKSQRLSWDRSLPDGSYFNGVAPVVTSVQLKNSKGTSTMGNLVSETRTILITP